MELHSIISLLSDGEFHSGSELGRILGVSRTAVWKAIGQLEALNLPLDSVKGRGYRLSRPIELLDEHVIRSHLDKEVNKDVSIDLLLQTSSTNTYLLSKPLSEKKYNCCLAEYQSAGKGRRGRRWVSPFASNVYLSMAFDLDAGADALSGLSLVVGLSVVKSLKNKGVQAVELKWPNDVWLEGRKLAGILVELSGEATTSWRVVLGLGLNLSMTQEDASEIDQPWACLSDVLSVSRNELVGCLISGLVEDLKRFTEFGFGVFLDDWHNCDGLNGKEVVVNGGALEGVARGVDAAGALLLEVNGELTSINAGEVSVRCL